MYSEPEDRSRRNRAYQGGEASRGMARGRALEAYGHRQYRCRGTVPGTVTMDIVIIGAGPSGLACAIEATKRGLTNVVLEKGCITNSVFHFPPQMIFFTTPELLEIG